jgi:hypothetical protein
MFETMINALIFHGFKLFWIYGLLSSQKLGDWVEARWIIWHFQFFTTQYDGLNCFFGLVGLLWRSWQNDLNIKCRK